MDQTTKWLSIAALAALAALTGMTEAQARPADLPAAALAATATG